MKFWDSSAVLPLLVRETTSVSVTDLLKSDATMFVWWATDVECTSALARLERIGDLTPAGLSDALKRLQALSSAWYIVQPVDSVKEVARRLLRVHPLRAADSLQLAAAVTAAKGRPSDVDFVCLDSRLASAAQKEGFCVVGANEKD